MKRWKIRKLKDERRELYGWVEWEISPWWSSFFPLYKSKYYYFSLNNKLPANYDYDTYGHKYRYLVDGFMEAERWNGWLAKAFELLSEITYNIVVYKIFYKIKGKINSLRTNDDDYVPF